MKDGSIRSGAQYALVRLQRAPGDPATVVLAFLFLLRRPSPTSPPRLSLATPCRPPTLSSNPEQFSPYLFFGCELKKHFNGTLFRFPLRTATAARDSEISHASYSPDSVKKLLAQFKEQANR